MNTPTLTLLLALAALAQGQFLNSTIFPPTCNDCFCIPAPGQACPTTIPPTVFNFTQQLKSMKWRNPIRLNCNPYPYAEQEGCGLTDQEGKAYEPELGSEAVCGILVEEDDVRANQCLGSYTTKSFASAQEAQAAGYQVTHTGACGACSSTQDLAIYIENPDLQGAGQNCGIRALSNETDGLECYKEVGFSPACAAAWLYDTTNTRENCFDTCIAHIGKPPNQDAPECPLNDCINCNEVKTGPYFVKYAARTRRGSGLLSYIIRNCSELVSNVVPLNPCPNGYIPGLEEESYPQVDIEVLPGTLESSSSSALLSLVPWMTTLLVVFSWLWFDSSNHDESLGKLETRLETTGNPLC